MRKVFLTMKEQEKYEVIKKLVETDENKNRAALKLGCTVRNVNRLIIVYKTEGKSGFVHKNRGKEPCNKITSELKNQIVLLYQGKYYGANFKHFTELLKIHENIDVSESTVRNIFSKFDILSPKCRRITKRKQKTKT